MSAKSAKQPKSAAKSMQVHADASKVTPKADVSKSPLSQPSMVKTTPGSQEIEGERPSAPLTWQQQIANKCHMKHATVREFLAEFLGTLVLVAFGCACVAQFVVNPSNEKHNIVSLQLGWGLAVALGVFVAGGASGGHLNPAVSVAFAVMGRLKGLKVLVYLGGQYFGAFFGAMIVYITYKNALDNCMPIGPATWEDLYKGNCSAARAQIPDKICCGNTAGIFATYPQSVHITIWQGFVDQVFGTGMLMLMICAITDGRNMEVPKRLVPIAIGMAILALLVGFESNCGAALNPARDLGPRIFTTMAGWSVEPFSYRRGTWFWVPVVGPHVGALLGAWLYNICVGLHWPKEEAPPPGNK